MLLATRWMLTGAAPLLLAALVAGCGGRTTARDSAPVVSAVPGAASTTPGPASAPPTGAPAPAARRPCAAIPIPTAVPRPGPDGKYAGPLFETHLHGQPGAPRTADAFCRYLDAEQTLWAIRFGGLAPDAQAQYVAFEVQYATDVRERVVSLLQPHSGTTGFRPFADGAITAEYLLPHLAPRGPYRGVGEIGLYRPELAGVTLAGPQFATVYQAVGAIGGVVMVHPRERESSASRRAQDSADLEAVLKANPNITFLFHGGSTVDEFETAMLGLMAKYPNLYYTWDTNHMLMGPWGMLGGGGDKYAGAQQFVDAVNRVGLDAIVQDAVRRALPAIRAHPDRILWGTDRSPAWNIDDPGRALLIELTRRFIGQLPPELQEGYAFRNAYRVFGPLLGGAP